MLMFCGLVATILTEGEEVMCVFNVILSSVCVCVHDILDTPNENCGLYSSGSLLPLGELHAIS